MDVQFKETKPLNILGATQGRAGSYAIARSPVRFENCRERFACQWHSRTKAIFFRHDADGRKIAKFILKTEQIVHEKKHTNFALTTCKPVLWVEPSRFWMRCRMRRALFTILLRAGMSYDPDQDNYEEALFSDAYAKSTRYAVMRFLFGFTKYVGPTPGGSSTLETSGWVAILKKSTQKEIREYFQSPKRRPYQPTYDLTEEIWI